MLVRHMLLVLLVVTSVDALAQTAPPTRYPWDKRPGLCFQAGALNDSRCQADDWPSWTDTFQRVTLLYNSEQFVLLERAMHELASSKKVFVNGDSPASAAYWAFRRLMPGPGTHQSHQAKIDRWKNAVPASDYVTFAQARFVYGDAWNARGSGAASSVSKQSWELFGIRLQQAEQILLNGSEVLKRTPFWHNLLLAIVLDGHHGKRNVEAVFHEAVRLWPRYFELYELRLTRLVPKWGGSWEQVESFIDRWSHQLSASEGMSVYARLYISVKNQGVAPEQTRMDWARMKASLEDLTNRYPSPDFKNLSASYACFAQDKAAFRTAMAKLSPGELDQRDWLSGHSYEACIRWAGI